MANPDALTAKLNEAVACGDSSTAASAAFALKNWYAVGGFSSTVRLSSEAAQAYPQAKPPGRESVGSNPAYQPTDEF